MVNEGRRVIERRGDLLRPTPATVSARGCDRVVYGFAKMGCAVIGNGERAAMFICVYTEACRDALSLVSTMKLSLVKLPVDDTSDSGDPERKMRLSTFYEDCQR